MQFLLIYHLMNVALTVNHKLYLFPFLREVLTRNNTFHRSDVVQAKNKKLLLI